MAARLICAVVAVSPNGLSPTVPVICTAHEARCAHMLHDRRRLVTTRCATNWEAVFVRLTKYICTRNLSNMSEDMNFWYIVIYIYTFVICSD